MTERFSAALLEAFAQQAKACETLGSPFNATICGLLPEILDTESEFGRRIINWPLATMALDAVALRCCGALHALARSGDAGLVAVYPPVPTPERAALASALKAAIKMHDRRLSAWLDSPPQTNEVSRSALILGGFLTLAKETKLPLSLFEIGASAGLNLLFDRYSYDLGDGRAWGDPQSKVKIESRWSGNMPDLAQEIVVAERAGCDIKPIDAANPDDRFRLMAYIWPDQAARLARIGAALDAAAREGLHVEPANAADWVDQVLAPEIPGRVKILYHTIMWQYLPQDVRARIEARIATASQAATAAAPFARLAMEMDDQRPGAGLRLTLWPGGEERLIARVDFHGRWAEWL